MSAHTFATLKPEFMALLCDNTSSSVSLALGLLKFHHVVALRRYFLWIQ
jgi:hypothetical protein